MSECRTHYHASYVYCRVPCVCQMRQTFNSANIDGFEAHQVRQLFQDDRPQSTVVLVNAVDLALYPVGPVQVVT